MTGPQILLCLNPTANELAFLAGLYRAWRFDSPATGLVNPLDPRYSAGGVHFDRSPEWFVEKLAIAGARLQLVEDRKALVGYGLYFTDVDHFPSFADGVLQYRNIPGFAALGYTYLFVLDKNYLGRGWGWLLMDAMRKDAASLGVKALAHEVFVRPVVNVSSVSMHGKMAKRWGAADTGRTAMHEVTTDGGAVQIAYAHYLIPTEDGKRVEVSPSGQISLV